MVVRFVEAQELTAAQLPMGVIPPHDTIRILKAGDDKVLMLPMTPERLSRLRPVRLP